MATAAGSIAGHSYWNSGWIPSGTTYEATSSQTCYAGGSYPYVMKFTVPSVSGDLSSATLTFSLFAVKGSSASVSFNYRISASGKDGSTNTVPSGLVSGSVTFSDLTASGYQGTFATAAVNLSAGGTYYLWLYGGTYFQAYKHASYYSVTLNYDAYTACGAPAACSVNGTTSEGDVTLSWSGASSGTNNAISAYEIQYSESSDNSSWGSWVALTTVSTTATSGGVTVSPPSTRGNYRRFQVRTQGTAGSSYYSGWTVSTNSVRKATLPGAPSACSVSATLAEGPVTLSWSGASNGAGHPIASYEIQYSDSADNASWGGWTVLTTVTTTATSGSLSVSPPTTRGYYRRFQVRTISALGSSYYSDWKVSANSVRKNTLPAVPAAFTASPATYSNENVTLSWSGAAAGTSVIQQYNIENCTSTDGSTWTSWAAFSTVATSSTSGSLAVTPSTIPGTYTKYRISVTDSLGTVSSAYKESNGIYCSITACGAPTACSVSATLAEGSVTLSWSGAGNGAGNTITSYEIQFSESGDGSTWGSWAALTTVNTTATSGSVSVSPSTTRGYYRRFQVRARGSAGSSYYSAWKVSTNSVRKNTLPAAPTSFAASPAIYEVNTITLSWSGVAAGTSPIKQCVIQQCTSTDGSAWAAYETLATVVTDATSGSYSATASGVAGTYTRYRISVTDTLGAVSSYAISGAVKKNSPPAVPIIDAPKAGSATYNPTPRFLIATGTEPDIQTQKVCVKIGTADWQDSVSNSESFSQNGYLGNGVKTIHQAAPQSTGSIPVTFRCLDNGIESASMEVSRTFTVLPSPFEEIAANETRVKATHIRTVREAINIVRDYYGLAPVSWSEDVVAGKTAVKNWPFYIREIRSALEPVVALINQFDPVPVFDVPVVNWLPLGTGRPRAAVMQEIQDLILAL